MTTAAQLEARSEESRKKCFEAFMARPATRLLVSMIPPGDHREALTTLLQECFEMAWASATANSLALMLESFLRNTGDHHNRKPPV
jgi:hypothetical protein